MFLLCLDRQLTHAFNTLVFGQIDEVARKSAVVVQQDAHRRISRQNEKLKLTVQRQNGLLKEVCFPQLVHKCALQMRWASNERISLTPQPIATGRLKRSPQLAETH